MIRKYIFLAVLAFIAASGCNNSRGNTPIVVDENPANKSETTATAVTTAPIDSEGKTIKMTKETFLTRVMDYEANPQEWVYKGDLPCLIDFYADWCGPCKTAAPILEELAEEYKGQIYIYKVDTEVERELSSVFGIRSIPAFLFVPQEGQPTMSNGIARTKEETKEMFRKMIDELLLEKAESAS